MEAALGEIPYQNIVYKVKINILLKQQLDTNQVLENLTQPINSVT